MADFTHKGRTITVTPEGTFAYISNGSTVRRPSLKAAQQAIDKEVGQVLVPAMTYEGNPINIAGRHRTWGYVNEHGSPVGRHGKILPYNEAAAAKIAELRERRQEADRIHRDALDAIHRERVALLRELGDFDYEAEVKKLAAQAPESPTEAQE